jgi:hypothetical protein
MRVRRFFPADGIKPMGPPDGLEVPAPHLTPEHRMLLRMRETLYEGDWADFVRDLEARLAEKPYVFETVAPSAQVRVIIETHLRMIREMSEWEGSTGLRLEARSSDG